MSLSSPSVNNNAGTDSSPISLKQLDSLIDISFNSVSKDSNVDIGVESRFIKVGGLTYKFLDVDPLQEDSKNTKLLNQTLKSATFEQEIKSKTAEQATIETPTTNTNEQDKDFTLYTAISHGLIIRLLPQNTMLFLEDLNANLRNFIKDTVEVIRNLDKNEYQFKFGKLDLEVHIRHEDNKLFVQLLTGKNGDIKSLTEEERIQLINLLQKDFPDDEIEVTLLDGFQDTLFQEDSGENDNSDDQSKDTEDIEGLEKA
jgi:hypothetical protein